MGPSGKPRVSDPKDPVLWCKEASSRLEAGDDKGALFCYMEAVKIRQQSADVWFNIVSLGEKCGEKATAFAATVTAEKLFPNDYRFPAEQARMFAGEKKYAKAVEAIERAAAINPYAPVLLSNKAGYLLFAGGNEKAVDAADAALAIDPAYVPAYLHKAHALVNLGKLKEADELLEAAASDPRARKMQANICIRMQEFTRARDKAASAADENPEDDEAWSLLGASYAYLEEFENAADAFGQAVRLNPKEKSYRANLAAVKREKR